MSTLPVPKDGIPHPASSVRKRLGHGHGPVVNREPSADRMIRTLLQTCGDRKVLGSGRPWLGHTSGFFGGIDPGVPIRSGEAGLRHLAKSAQESH